MIFKCAQYTTGTELHQEESREHAKNAAWPQGPILATVLLRWRKLKHLQMAQNGAIAPDSSGWLQLTSRHIGDK